MRFAEYVQTFVKHVVANALITRPNIARSVQELVSSVLKNVGRWQRNSYNSLLFSFVRTLPGALLLSQCLLLQVAHLFLLSFFIETVECYNENFKTYLPAFSRTNQE
jgi:hypothetical protein